MPCIIWFAIFFDYITPNNCQISSAVCVAQTAQGKRLDQKSTEEKWLNCFSYPWSNLINCVEHLCFCGHCFSPRAGAVNTMQTPTGGVQLTYMLVTCWWNEKVLSCRYQDWALQPPIVFICNYTRCLNNMGLNCAGPFTHGFFFQ